MKAERGDISVRELLAWEAGYMKKIVRKDNCMVMDSPGHVHLSTGTSLLLLAREEFKDFITNSTFLH